MTGRRIFLCSTVDSFLQVAGICRRCSIRWQLPNIKNNQGIVFLEEIPHSSKYSVLPMGDQLIRLFAERIESLSLVQILLTSHGSGDSRTVELVFSQFLCDWSLLSELLSEVHLEFCNQRCRDKCPCTPHCDFLRDACDECPRDTSDEFPRSSRFVRFDGRRMFSLRDWKDFDVHVANLA